jgi:hypothetical protein
MSSTGQKVGAGAVVIAVLGLLGVAITFVDNHWSGTFGGGTDNAGPAVASARDAGDTTSGGAGFGPEAVDPDIFLSRDQVPVDGTLDVSGEGFAPDETVVITIGTFEVARPTTNDQGGFSNVEIGIPEFYRDFQKPLTVKVIATSKPDFQYTAQRDLVVT